VSSVSGARHSLTIAVSAPSPRSQLLHGCTADQITVLPRLDNLRHGYCRANDGTASSFSHRMEIDPKIRKDYTDTSSQTKFSRTLKSGNITNGSPWWLAWLFFSC
jgi:hypothetical protein